MNDRDRFIAVMNYQPVDRLPIKLVGPWPQTLARWRGEGLADGEDVHALMGIQSLHSANLSGNTGIHPAYEQRLIRQDDEFIISIDSYGRTQKVFKEHESMPEWIDFPVVDRETFRRALDEHFDVSDMDARYDAACLERAAQRRGEDVLTVLDGGCYYWTLRSLTGVENASFLLHDATDLVDELFERINTVCIEGIRRIAKLTRIDVLGFGEDIAFKTGPLLSPDMFRRLILPRYRKVVKEAREHGIHLTWYDSDGDLRMLLPDCMEAGIDCVAPCEVAANMDPVALRRTFGRGLRMIGGVDKRRIAAGRHEIDLAMEELRPVMAEGGYIPCIDHSVSADISLENYRYFLRRLVEMSGQGTRG
ncbi:MAG: hypothetical protein IT440_04785 [Phycisphaeraceae bacterium]|nr:hypothetical protein [Phycisphaeraceae bacterium]